MTKEDRQGPSPAEEPSRFRQMMRRQAEEVYLVKPDGELVYVNDAAAAGLGYTREEMLRIGVLGFDPLFGPRFSSHFEELKAGNQAPFETIHIAKDGRKVFKEMRSVYLNIEGNEYVCGFGRDITERRHVEEALRVTQFAIDHTADLAFWTDAGSRFIYVNDTACRVLGYTREELLGMKVNDIDRDFSEDIWKDHWRELREKKAMVFETVHRARDGRTFPVEMQTNFVEFEGREYNCAFARDITERKQAEDHRIVMERRLLQTQKLESLGVMAGGIAHDFNNLLMAILGNLDLALVSTSSVSPARSNIEQVIQATHSAADLTRQMLAYSGKGRFMIGDIDINELIEENAHLFRASVSRNTSLNFQLASGIHLISADAGQVQQVIMNLVANASEAIGERTGEITVSTSMADCEDEYLTKSRIEEKPQAGRFVCLEVRDTGCGMDRGVLDRIFDPFFSTKFTGRGLGMCAVMGIVRGHKGALVIESAAGEGTTVKVYLPAVDRTSKRITAAGDVTVRRLEEERKTLSRRTVLVVDDEEMVREVCCAMLQELGFDVVAAEDGAQAVEIFRARIGEIDCVLLDLSMPKMDGLAAFQEISGLKPNVNVILVSGYNEQEAIQRFSAQGLAGFIQKPYRFETLRKELDKVLSSL